jgi:ribosomal protein S1
VVEGVGDARRSRAACWSTSACRSSCRRRRSTSAARATSATTSARQDPRQILKIDEERMNIVISRRKLIERSARRRRSCSLETLKEGEVVKGTVKNIADFGAFVDLGGIDGLLHITDMSWGRINHPSEMVKIDDRDRGQGPQHRPREGEDRAGPQAEEASPWEEIEKKYPVGSRVRATVVNLMSYGAFVQARGRHRGPRAHLRDVLDQAHQPPERAGQSARRSRSSSSRSTRRSRRSRSA